jgi:hypothetical protein
MKTRFPNSFLPSALIAGLGLMVVNRRFRNVLLVFSVPHVSVSKGSGQFPHSRRCAPGRAQDAKSALQPLQIKEIS